MAKHAHPADARETSCCAAHGDGHEHAHAHQHAHEHPDEHGCCGSVHGKEVPARPHLRGRTFKVSGLDCAEEVAVLKREIGPLVGGEDRLAFDVLNGRMTVADDAQHVPDRDIEAAVGRTGMAASR